MESLRLMEKRKWNLQKIGLNKMKKFFAFLLLLSISTIVFGWGQTGHRAIAKIAQNNLSKKAIKELHKIMGDESLVEASTWMDEIKSDSTYNYARRWHYVTVPSGKTYETSEKNETGDAFEAVIRLKEIVKNVNSTLLQKREAIRMLVHIVGDMHQPLHVGNGQDKGGNSIKIKWFNKYSNLHKIWDSGIIDSKGLSYSELAEIIDHSKNGDRNFNSTNMDDWISEAQALRPQIYSTAGKKNLSYNYIYQNWDTVKDQLLKGGIRLANVLNELLGS